MAAMVGGGVGGGRVSEGVAAEIKEKMGFPITGADPAKFHPTLYELIATAGMYLHQGRYIAICSGAVCDCTIKLWWYLSLHYI